MRNERPGSRQQPAGAAAGSTTTSLQLCERQDLHRAEQAVQVARPDGPPGRHVCFDCHAACGPYTTRTRRVLRRCALTANGLDKHRKGIPGTSLPNKGMSRCGAGLRWRKCTVLFGRSGGRFGLTRAASS